MTQIDYFALSEEKDLYFKKKTGEDYVCYFFPKGVTKIFRSLEMCKETELYGYCPPDDVWYDYCAGPCKISSINRMTEIDKEEALGLCPALQVRIGLDQEALNPTPAHNTPILPFGNSPSTLVTPSGYTFTITDAVITNGTNSVAINWPDDLEDDFE